MQTVWAKVLNDGAPRRQMFRCLGRARYVACPIWTFALTTGSLAHAQDVGEPSPAETPHAPDERCAIAYQAPSTCPSAAAMSEAAGPHFRVVTSSTCPDCVSRVNISPATDGSPEYVLQTGDEFTRSPDCAELVKIAGFTVRSSHVHRPAVATPPFLFLGAHVGQVIARDLQWVFGAQVGVRLFDDWLIRPHVGWIPESRVTVSINNDRLDPTFEGYQGGLDVCRLVANWAGVCAQSSFESFRVVPSSTEYWIAPYASQVMFGLGATLQTRVASDLLVQLQPAAFYAPKPAQILDSDWSVPFYERPALQVQLRAGLAWGFGGKDPSEDAGANFAQTGPARITH